MQVTPFYNGRAHIKTGVYFATTADGSFAYGPAHFFGCDCAHNLYPDLIRAAGRPGRRRDINLSQAAQADLIQRASCGIGMLCHAKEQMAMRNLLCHLPLGMIRAEDDCPCGLFCLGWAA